MPVQVVEGSDDRHFMEHFICSDCCEIVVAQGKQKVCDVIRILENDCFPGCLGLVDADLNRIEGWESHQGGEKHFTASRSARKLP